jgi:hypothetical protein
MQSRRASPRIPYDEAICLTRTDGSGRLYARGMDLGTGGMALVCAEACPIDTEVRCDLLLRGGPRAVAGRVVRVTAAPGGFELAVAFHDLKPGTSAVIQEMIAAHDRQVLPAKLQIDGVDTPLRCQASDDEQTLRVTATLPFLQLDRGVNVVLGAEEAVAASGTIRKIAVDPSSGDGVPRLALDVDLGESPRAQTQPYGKPRATPVPDAEPAAALAKPPTSLPPPCGQPLPSVLVEAALVDPADVPTPAPTPRAAPPPPAPPPRPPAPGRPRGAPMRGTAVVARRPGPPDWRWQPPAVVVVAPAPAAVAPRRASLLDAPLSARTLVVLAPILALVAALVVQLSR